MSISQILDCFVEKCALHKDKVSSFLEITNITVLPYCYLKIGEGVVLLNV